MARALLIYRAPSITRVKLKNMPFCHKCGKEVPESAKFCSACGAAILQVTPRREVAKRPIPWTWLVIAVIVIVAVIASASILFSALISPVGIYKAEDTKSYAGVVTVDRVYFEVDNFNGPIHVSTWNKAEYKIDVRIIARGDSQKSAEDNLNDLKIVLDDSIIQEQKRLVLKYDVPFLAYGRYSIEVNAVLPANSVIDLDLESSNGGVYLTNIKGQTLRLATSNGPIVFDGAYAESIKGQTSNGYINGRIEAKDTSLSTSNSRIELTIPCSISAKYVLSTSNGAIALAVSPSSEVGYDLDLSTSNGNISIGLSNLNYSQDQKNRKEAQTKEFISKTVQILIEASTSNSNIDVAAE